MISGSSFLKLACLLSACSTSLALVGCSSLDNCPTALDPITIESGNTDADRLYYESAPFGGELAAFPAKTALWFEHGLGVTPLDVKAYLSFSKNGTHDREGGSVAESAGNQALIDCVDSRVVVVRNDTCERDFFIRLTASGAAFQDNGEACGRPR